MTQNNRARSGPFAGLPQGAADLAAAALKCGNEWGGNLGREVLAAAKQAARAHREGRELEGRGLALRNSPEAVSQIAAAPAAMAREAWGKLNAAPATALGLALGGPTKLARWNQVGAGWGNDALQFTNVPWLPRDSALTLGNVQLYSPQKAPNDVIRSPYTGQTMRTGDHEELHSRRFERDGWLGYPVMWARGGGISNSNPAEIEADDYGARKYRSGSRR